jgi:hypothetical protein
MSWQVYRVTAATHNRDGKPRPRVGTANSFVARAPGCPEGPHPTRDCGCRIFKNPADAEAYANEKNSPEEGTHGTAA